jgi:hypothetical protein
MGLSMVVGSLGRLLDSHGCRKSRTYRTPQHYWSHGPGQSPVVLRLLRSLLTSSFSQELKHYIEFLVPTERYVAILGWSIAIFATWKPFIEDRSIDQNTSEGNGRILFYWFRVR